MGMSFFDASGTARAPASPALCGYRSAQKTFRKNAGVSLGPAGLRPAGHSFDTGETRAFGARMQRSSGQDRVRSPYTSDSDSVTVSLSPPSSPPVENGTATVTATSSSPGSAAAPAYVERKA
jgi:hypothetical protein